MEADTNLANPPAVIWAVITPSPGPVAILLADKLPNIVTSDVIVPPVSKNLEPVIPPSAFRVKPPAELDILFEPITNPPIFPFVVAVILVAVISPDIFALDAVMSFIITSPSFCKWNLDELISILLLLPLTNCEPTFPKKNFGVWISTELPLIVVSPAANIFKFPCEPLINWLPLPKKNLSVSMFTDEPLR